MLENWLGGGSLPDGSHNVAKGYMEDIEGMIKVGRPLLQRRNSLTNMFQALLDAFLVLCLFVGFVQYTQGVLLYSHVIFVLLLMGSMAVIYDGMGIYRKNRSNLGKSFDLLKAWCFSLAISLAFIYLLEALDGLAPDFILPFSVAAFTLQLLSHLFLRRFHLIRSSKAKVNALVIGDQVFANRLKTRINNNPWVREKVSACIELSSLSEPDNFLCNVSINKAKEIIRNDDIRSVYLALPFNNLALVQDLYKELMELNVDVHWIPDIHELQLINPSVKELAGYPVLTLSETPLIGTHHLKKAVVDKVLALIALLALSWLMLGTALAIKLTSPGPVFFRQPRTGWDGKEFMIWKFRSMKVHQEEPDKVTQATRHDDRITPVGRFIRKTSIDELPQLFNVLIGNMSMVGPRPHAVQHNQIYSTQINAYLCRHRIKPGITGLAQVRGLRGETEELELMSKRVESDLEYINNWSVSLDIMIMIRTALTLINSRAY
ncbi:undecaprenyl-phosphate glucose phosphotransferase [Neptuniibacter caesariensis]|nr:undecaprenyl-phosphate glucose phosphotransferase [Neptuniibacter caesariensis]